MPNQKQNGQINEHQERKLPRGVKLLRTLGGHNDILYGLAFDPKGRMLASASGNYTVKLWGVMSGLLLRTLEGHKYEVNGLAFDPKGRMLASASDDNTVKLWEVGSGRLLWTLKGHSLPVYGIAFDSGGQMLASAGSDNTVKLWEVGSGRLLRTLEGHDHNIWSVRFNPKGRMLASASSDNTVKLWEVGSGRLLRTLEGHEFPVYSIAFDPRGQILASASGDYTVRLWKSASGRLLRTLEGHTGPVDAIAFSLDGRLLISKSADDTLRLWSCETWATVAVIPEPTHPDLWMSCVASNPTLPMLASVGSKLDASEDDRSKQIHLFELDYDMLLGKAAEALPARKARYHTTAKVVLVGDHSVGKSGLGWRLKHKEFKEQASTHGQQFWVLPELGGLREDGTECEAILWDLAGQPDYRLIHALFLDDVDLALILFDSSNISDPLHGVEFWLKQLTKGKQAGGSEEGNGQSSCLKILVGAQADRGSPTLTVEELESFCERRGISGYLSTSAKEGWGLDELLERMKKLIAWDDKPATVTTVTFKRIKDFVLGLKEKQQEGQAVIVSAQELRRQLEETDAEWQFTDAEMLTAVGHLENYGYVKKLRTSKGEERVLLAPELLNNLAASFVLEARRNLKGLGSLEEQRLMACDYPFPELKELSQEERDILLDSAALLFLEHNVCFRETDPLGGKSYLVFPELINLKRPPLDDEQPTEDGVAYTVSGYVENVHASLVVLLGYTEKFTRTNQWRNQARYEVGDSLICGFRQDDERDGELDFVLYFGTNVGQPVRTLFQGLFESFLARRNLSVFRFELVICSKGHALNRVVVRDELRSGNTFAFCSKCGERLSLPKADEPIQLTQTERRKVDEQRWFAEQRTRFEQAVFQLMSYVEGEKLARPECFISYAWGDREQERWVERNLAKDLQKSGINVVLDRWENDRAGKSVSRFVSRIADCNIIIPVGTLLYFEKFGNKVSSMGSVVAAEVDLISQRLMGAEAEKETVMPILLAGEKKRSMPPLMWDRVYRDFRNERGYFITAFDLILDLYSIAHTDTAVADLRESLQK